MRRILVLSLLCIALPALGETAVDSVMLSLPDCLLYSKDATGRLACVPAQVCGPSGQFSVWRGRDIGFTCEPTPTPTTATSSIASCLALPTGTGVLSHPYPTGTSSGAPPAYAYADPASTGVLDPATGVKLIRVSGTVGEALVDKAGAGIIGVAKDGTTVLGIVWRDPAGSRYPKEPAWNADQSLLVLRSGVAGESVFLDGNTYDVKAARAAPNPYSGGVYLWLPPDTSWIAHPEKYVVLTTDGGAVGIWDPIANTTQMRYDPGAGYTGAILGNYEGALSRDGRFVVVVATRSSDSRKVFYMVDLASGTRASPVIDPVASLGWTSLDWAGPSANGTYLVASQDWTKHAAIRVDGACATTFSAACVQSTWTYMGHYDLGISAAGEEVAYNSGEPEYVVLATGAHVALPDPSPTDWHSSSRAVPGWGLAVVKTSSGNVANELYWQELKAGGAIKRFAYTYRSTSTDADHNIFGTPSWDGRRVLFRTDWGNPAGPVYAFVADARNVCP